MFAYLFIVFCVLNNTPRARIMQFKIAKIRTFFLEIFFFFLSHSSTDYVYANPYGVVNVRWAGISRARDLPTISIASSKCTGCAMRRTDESAASETYKTQYDFTNSYTVYPSVLDYLQNLNRKYESRVQFTVGCRVIHNGSGARAARQDKKITTNRLGCRRRLSRPLRPTPTAPRDRPEWFLRAFGALLFRSNKTIAATEAESLLILLLYACCRPISISGVLTRSLVLITINCRNAKRLNYYWSWCDRAF